MNDKKNFKTEYEKEKSLFEAHMYNRKRVEAIKRILVPAFITICAIPVLFCLYLVLRMNTMERKLDKIAEEFSYTSNTGDKDTLATKSAEGLFELDQAAYDDIGKSTVAHNSGLMDDGSNSKENLESKGPVIPNGKKVYLTFDDGPSTYTDEILDVLKEKNVKATFFVVHNPNESTWHAYKRIVDDGNVLAMHSYTHDYSKIYNSLADFKEDVNMIHDFLLEQTGYDCNLYRFPGGSSNSVSKVPIQDMMEFLYDEGIEYVDWNSLSGDAVDGSLTKKQLNDNIMKYVRANEGDSIVLMHDLQNIHTTVEALPELIDTLKSEGYEICPIDDNTKLVQHVKYEGIDE